ncbi:hypothetical protein [Maritalea mediterranea]|uniref:Transposase n=1 Tax=Maritalea mediterranea TaxID=2909667 RepID=A0ABS9EAY9_9HYPH|nr:hypothetical protein [Maritalea mediterranea]MCF4098598.1 hypothetical protein [Maritalea mediterranea]
MNALKHFGVKPKALPVRRKSLKNLIPYLKRHHRHLVWTTGHVQVVKDGWMVDQDGVRPVGLCRASRKLTCGVWLLD